MSKDCMQTNVQKISNTLNQVMGNIAILELLVLHYNNILYNSHKNSP